MRTPCASADEGSPFTPAAVRPDAALDQHPAAQRPAWVACMPLSPINLAVLVSGSGTTLQNLINQIDHKKLDARIKLVLGSRPGLPALQRASNAELFTAVVDRRQYPDVAMFSRRVFQIVDD